LAELLDKALSSNQSAVTATVGIVKMAGKRKREDTNGEVGNDTVGSNGTEQQQQELHQWLSDVIEIMKRSGSL